MSRLRHIIQAVYGSPLLMTPEAFRSVDMLLRSKLGESADMLRMTTRADDDDECETDFFGDKLPVAHAEGDVWVVPIHGIIGKRVSGIERSCGVCDVDQIRKDIAAGVADTNVKGILLDVASPGGIDTGVAELGDHIGGLRTGGKPIVAFTDTQMCSAAYWLSAGCNEIWCTPSADVGSIGVYIAYLDESANYAMQGYSVELFKGGRLKADGIPGTSLSDETRADLQSNVEAVYERFKGHVVAHRKSRGKVDDESMQGQSFDGAHALDRNLVDSIDFATLDDAIAALKQN